MKNTKIIAIFALFAIVFSACTGDKISFDASGSFEAEETIISSESAGVIKEFKIEEGQTLKAGQNIGYIDSVQLYLRKQQLLAQINAVVSKKPDVSVQIAALQSELKTAEREKIRISNLVKTNSVPTKQLDDVEAQIEVLNRQIAAQKSALNISTEGISKDAISLQVQIEQLNDQLSKCKLINPTAGTVLAKYAETNEMSTVGKPLYKIADLSNIILRVYITGDQLPKVKLNQNVKVLTDDGNGGFKETSGTISWINDKAEFTPKTIQTKNERANMVYAIKVNVKNDGSYKIGMYGEIRF
ncbi:MAG: efflux RND transporter periplasmic adaptor subunit [Flavobacteriaceae bacterium]|jgi:HlyD family secretion protein|nr:efflux RND transporter periplasmic adaptor subunit [Flavobacteriaceae bacterium]